MRGIHFILVATLISACAVKPPAASPNSNWARVSGERAGCVSYAPRRGEAVDLNIILKPAFEHALLLQLDEADRNALRCWYETPKGSIKLFSGDFCAGGMESLFEEHGDEWKLTGTNLVSITCRPVASGWSPNTSFERTRDR
jgi:hypothetical protein